MDEEANTNDIYTLRRLAQKRRQFNPNEIISAAIAQQVDKCLFRLFAANNDFYMLVLPASVDSVFARRTFFSGLFAGISSVFVCPGFCATLSIPCIFQISQ